MERNRILLFVSLLVGFVFFVSCKKSFQSENSESLTNVIDTYERDSFYYCGYFVFASDSSYFEDCATGNRFRFIENTLLDDIRARYEEMSEAQSIQIFGSMHGIMHYDPNNSYPLIEVVRFLGFNQTEGCNPNAVIADVYTVVVPNLHSPQYKVTISLDANYKFEWNEYDYQTKKSKTLSGKWGRVNEEDILFNVKKADDIQNKNYLSAYFDFPNMQLWVDTLKLHRR